MSGASWKRDRALERPEHKWVFSSAYAQKWGATVTFRCGNPGCATTRSVPCKPGPGSGGICFDRTRAIQLTDRDGNPVSRSSEVCPDCESHRDCCGQTCGKCPGTRRGA